jgi:hypothetical protein
MTLELFIFWALMGMEYIPHMLITAATLGVAAVI